jgi:hypothetical protein
MLKFPSEITEDNQEAYWGWLNEVADKNGIEYANWAADAVDFDAVAFPSTVTKLEHSTCWRESTYAVIPPNATWLDIWKLVDSLIKSSEDWDHCYIEQFDVCGDTVSVFLGS